MSKLITFLTLPMPPSANVYWRTDFKNKRIYVSEEGLEYRRKVALICAAQNVRTLAGDVEYEFRYQFGPRGGDVGNRLKVLEDSLNLWAWIDDAQVQRGVFERGDPANSTPWVAVTVNGSAWATRAEVENARTAKAVATRKRRSTIRARRTVPNIKIAPRGA